LCERPDAGFADHWHGYEIEGIEGFSGRQACFEELALGASLSAFGNFVLEQGSQGASSGPALSIGLFDDGGPEAADGGQAEFREQQRQACGIGGHAAIPPVWVMLKRLS
jgi:hypothetical protein